MVSYISDENKFGWLVGPRFAIGEDLDLTFEHTPLQESVQATIAVPAWWSSVQINAESWWLSKKGDFRYAPNNPYGHSGLLAGKNEYEVALRPQLEALTEAACELSGDPWFNQPQIHPIWDHEQKKWGYIVSTLSTGTQILIPGHNLWRNPVVFIGSQSTTNIQVLPDMRGIIATFSQINDVQALNPAEKGASRVDLRVATSDGESILKNAVTVLSGTISNKQDLPVTMTNFWAAPGPTPTGSTPAPPPSTNFVFSINTNTFNGSYYNFILTSRMPASPALSILATNSNDPDVKKGKLTFVLTNWPPAGAPAESLVNVLMRSSPASEPVSVLQGGEQTLVTFNNAGEINFVVDGTATVSTNAPNATSISVKLPGTSTTTTNVWHAYPGLQQAVQTNQVGLHLVSGVCSANLPETGYDSTSRTLVFTADYNQLTNGLPMLNADGTNVTCDAFLLVPAKNPVWSIPAGKITITRKDK